MDWMIDFVANNFYEFSIILALAALFGMMGQFFRQPLIVMFIALGIIVGPSVLDIIHSKENIHLLAEIGIAVLLFIVGLKLDFRIIKTVGKTALLTGIGQVLFTSLFGYLIAIAFGFSSMHSFYIAVALTFSSTIIIVKLLSDKKEIDSLHGQIAIGFLIVQDIVVILVMIVLSTLRNTENISLSTSIMQSLGSGAILLLVTWIFMRFIIPRLTVFLARSQELLVLFAIAWAMILATAGDAMHFSAEVGAFLAGVSLASSEFKDVIGSRLTSLRDFLLLFFFVQLGADLDLSVVGEQVVPAILFSLFVLIGNPIIVLIIMGVMGYRKRTSFLAGLTVAQISEFSLIFAGLGLSIGHITEGVVGLITLVGLITIGLSTYLILYSHQIYDWIKPFLRLFEREIPHKEDPFLNQKNEFTVIVVGLGRLGSKIADELEKTEKFHFLGVDFDPDTVKSWQIKNRNVIYGDMEDPDLIEYLSLNKNQTIICTVPLVKQTEKLVKNLRNSNFEGKIVLSAMRDTDYFELQKCQPDYIIRPFHEAADNFVHQL